MTDRVLLQRDSTIACMILLGLLLVYHLNGDFQYIRDAEASVYLPISLLNEGNVSFRPSEVPFMFTWELQTSTPPSKPMLTKWNTDLDELYRSGALKVSGANYNIVRSIRTDASSGEGLYVNAFGLGAGLTAVPAFFLLQAVVGNLADHPRLLWYAAKSVAALLAAASAALVYLAARRFLRRHLAALVALSYGLGTGVWSTSSQSLWQHSPNEFFLALGSYFLFRVRAEPAGRCSTRGNAACCALAFACALVCRPTSAVVLFAVVIYLAATDRNACVAYALAALPIVLTLGAYNAYYLGSPFNFGQAEIGRRLALAKTGLPGVWQTPLWRGMTGLLLSPSRGLFVFSPFLVFSLVGIWVTWRTREFTVLRPLTAALGVILVIEAKHFDWWGGWSYGYRHIVDTAVFFALLLIPVADWIARRRWRLAAYVLLLSWSLLVQCVGAFAYDVSSWNARLAGYYVRLPGEAQPILVGSAEQAKALVATRRATVVGEARLDVDRPEHRHRLWSLRDNQIAYYLFHFAECRRTKLDAVAHFGQ